MFLFTRRALNASSVWHCQYATRCHSEDLLLQPIVELMQVAEADGMECVAQAGQEVEQECLVAECLC